MKLYWTNKCRENGFRCPNCQNYIADKDGQMAAASKNHKISLLDGQVRCVVCSTVLGYFPRGNDENSLPVKFGWSAKILDTLDYVSPTDQKEFH